MSHFLARRLFLRLLGVVYLAAFLSLAWQVSGLLGKDGVLPAATYLVGVRETLGAAAPWRVPTLFWLGSSDASLGAACITGVVLSLLLVAGLLPLATLSLLWILYLSLVGIGQQFLSYQWDALLLESGFLAIFWAPTSWRLGAGSERRPSLLVLWLLRWLLFRLMFFSGFVKLASGDPTWWNLTALAHHYETQPLPAWTSWYMHQLPLWFQKLSCAGMFVVELVFPFLIFAGRRARVIAFAGLVGLQVFIAATGNYGFFNLLAIALCVTLLEDDHLVRFVPRARARREEEPPEQPWKTAADLVVAALVLVLTVPLSLSQGLGLRLVARPPLADLFRAVAPFHLVSTYGLFAVMTTTRPEIILEGSLDGTEWRPYVFRWKPGPLERAPGFVEPFMPRLDWQMWFDALYVERMLASGRSGFDLVTPDLLARLREGSRAVLGLLEADPFGGEKPRFLRWRLYDYRFTDWQQRTQNWWRRELLSEQPAR